MTTRAGDLLGEAMLMHQHGRPADADKLYRQCLELEPNNAQALRLCGILARDRNQMPSSLALLRRAVVVAPDDTRAHSELAISEMVSGDLESAESSFRSALNCDPESGRALANLGALLQRRGHLHEAIGFHRRYLDLEPGDLEVYCNLANALMDAGCGDEALDEIEKALAIAPDHPLLLANKGAVLCGLERFEPAVQALESAVAENSGDELAYINLGYARHCLCELDLAADALRQAVLMNPDSARASADLASVSMARGSTDNALEICERFLHRHPGERLTLATYAFALHDKGRRQEAEAILNFDELIKITDIEAPSGYSSIEEFNDAITARVQTHPSVVTEPTSKATMGGRQTGELNLGDSQELSALAKLIRTAVGQAALQWQGAGFSGHPAMAYATDTWALRLWGVILNEGGFQAPHLHPMGWLSGVYYSRLPTEISGDPTKAGWLEFGVPPERLAVTSAPKTFSVEPAEGRLVLFPSYFYHRTRPFLSDQERISIAFDVVPVSIGE
jgi:tetratricopeptide (TPR) repeat protein